MIYKRVYSEYCKQTPFGWLPDSERPNVNRPVIMVNVRDVPYADIMIDFRDSESRTLLRHISQCPLILDVDNKVMDLRKGHYALCRFEDDEIGIIKLGMNLPIGILSFISEDTTISRGINIQVLDTTDVIPSNGSGFIEDNIEGVINLFINNDPFRVKITHVYLFN